MNIYETVKSLVTVREAAERYGLNINRHSMACCPFHEDRHPSMKLDERYHCFGCGADGDVIDFTAKLFHLSPYEAADKLNQDFGAGCLPEPAHPQKETASQWHNTLPGSSAGYGASTPQAETSGYSNG